MSAWSIAVIIPTFNSMRFFSETLDSVLKQTLLPDEIIVNDDGSADGTPEFAESYGQAILAQNPSAPAIRVLRRSGQRQAKSRNFAATQTECEWIAFLDHDDIWEPNKLQRQVEELSRTGADLCYTSLVTFEQVGDTVDVRETPRVPPADSIRKALYHSTTFLPSSVLVRRSAFVKSGGFNTKFTVAEDWELWLRLLHTGAKFAACEEPLVRFRIHGRNQSRNAYKSLEEAMDVYREYVLPRQPAKMRWLIYRFTRSEHEFAAALALRNNGDPRQIRMLLTSLATSPFTNFHRYKVLAHMMYMRLRSRFQPVPVPGPSDEAADRSLVAFPAGADEASRLRRSA